MHPFTSIYIKNSRKLSYLNFWVKVDVNCASSIDVDVLLGLSAVDPHLDARLGAVTEPFKGLHSYTFYNCVLKKFAVCRLFLMHSHLYVTMDFLSKLIFTCVLNTF